MLIFQFFLINQNFFGFLGLYYSDPNRFKIFSKKFFIFFKIFLVCIGFNSTFAL